MADDERPVSPYYLARVQARERREAQDRAESVPHPRGCLCYECEVEKALAVAERTRRVAPRQSRTEFRVDDVLRRLGPP